ncbi:hypothetical protein [Paenibacillus sp. V4I7]
MDYCKYEAELSAVQKANANDHN